MRGQTGGRHPQNNHGTPTARNTHPTREKAKTSSKAYGDNDALAHQETAYGAYAHHMHVYGAGQNPLFL